jgi:hypothetical protein
VPAMERAEPVSIEVVGEVSGEVREQVKV